MNDVHATLYTVGGNAVILPVPPQSNGTDSGLGLSSWHERFNGSAPATTVSSGPNAGFTFLNQQPQIVTDFQYELNPDLEDQNSTFFKKQSGTNGFISGVVLEAQTRRHEYNHPFQSHFGEFANTIGSNNLGDAVESLVTGPGSNSFNDNLLALRDSIIPQNTSAPTAEPYPVNSDAANNFLGNICYPNYTACP